MVPGGETGNGQGSQAERAAIARMNVEPFPVTDPAALEAIEAALMLQIYQARRLAHRRFLGLSPAPRPNPVALALLRDERSRRAAPRALAPDR